MTIAERIYKFLVEHKPDRFCDDCLRRELELARRQEAAPITKALGLTTEFVRGLGLCVSCPDPRTKLVIRAM